MPVGTLSLCVICAINCNMKEIQVFVGHFKRHPLFQGVPGAVQPVTLNADPPGKSMNTDIAAMHIDCTTNSFIPF